MHRNPFDSLSFQEIYSGFMSGRFGQLRDTLAKDGIAFFNKQSGGAGVYGDTVITPEYLSSVANARYLSKIELQHIYARSS